MLNKLKGTEPEVVATMANDKKAVAALIKDLGGPEPRTRARVAFLLAQLPEPPESSVPKLVTQIKKEKEELVKASLLLAVAEISRKLGVRVGTDIVDKATGDDSERSAKAAPVPVRLAAIVALSRMNPIYLTPTMVDFLRTHTGLRVDPVTMPWNDGDLGGLAALVLPFVEAPDVDAALAELTERIKTHPPNTGEGPRWGDEVSWPWYRTLKRVLAPLGKRQDDEPLVSELSTAQRRVLTFGVEHNLMLVEAQHGLDFQMPQDLTWPSWRRYLELDPPGPLDRILTVAEADVVKTLPVWKWFRKLTRGQIGAAPLAKALREALSPVEIVDLARDVTGMIYGVPREDGLAPSPRASLMRELLESAGPSATARDLDGIRYVLDALHNHRGWGLKAAGWKYGPFLPTK